MFVKKPILSSLIWKYNLACLINFILEVFRFLAGFWRLLQSNHAIEAHGSDEAIVTLQIRKNRTFEKQRKFLIQKCVDPCIKLKNSCFSTLHFTYMCHIYFRSQGIQVVSWNSAAESIRVFTILQEGWKTDSWATHRFFDEKGQNFSTQLLICFLPHLTDIPFWIVSKRTPEH